MWATPICDASDFVNAADRGAGFRRQGGGIGGMVAMGMGQHPNDLGLSFYVVSPSGFEVELGHEPRKIGPEWEVRDYRGISKWGHQPEFRPSLGKKMKSGWTALRSLVRQD